MGWFDQLPKAEFCMNIIMMAHLKDGTEFVLQGQDLKSCRSRDGDQKRQAAEWGKWDGTQEHGARIVDAQCERLERIAPMSTAYMDWLSAPYVSR